MTDRIAQLQEALARMGNTHSFEDVLAGIASGAMQSFARGETWAVTQIIEFPQKKILEIVLVIGDMADAEVLHDEVVDFARAEGCALIRTYARTGFAPWAKARGWRNGASLFLKEL